MTRSGWPCPHKAGDDGRNVLFNDMNSVFADYALSADEMTKWEKIIEVRDAVNGALETARAEKKIGKSLEADVALTVPAEDAFLAEMDSAVLADLLIVSQVEVTVGGELAVSVSEAAGTKCPPLLEAQHQGRREWPVSPLRQRDRKVR